jgi:biotin carboxylase
MKKLYVILVNYNVVRSTLEELTQRTDAQYWLLASPHYLAKLSDRHRVIFGRILEQEDFTTGALIDRMERELGALRPEKLLFLTDDESSELTCLDLQEHFGDPLWSVEQVLPFVNKMVSKRELSKANIRLPRHLLFDKQRYLNERNAYCKEIASAIGFPMVTKPVDRSASMDVHRIDDMHQFYRWASWCSSPKDRNTYEVDEFIEGELFHCDILIQDGTIIWSNACKNVNPCMQFAFGHPIGAFNIPAEAANAVAVRALGAAVLAALDPPNGAIHMECFRLASGELVFLEASARPPGGGMVDLYTYCFGFDLHVAHFMLRAKESYRLEVRDTPRYGCWVAHPKRQGRIKAVHLPSLQSESRVRLNVGAGQQIGIGSQHIAEEPAAEFWVYSGDYAHIEHDARALKELQLCEMDGG